MMTIYKVTFYKKNFNRYFQDDRFPYDTKEKYFTTKEKAEQFVATELTEFVPTWNRDEIVKPANEGKITEEIVE